MTAKADDFLVAIGGGLLVLFAVLPEVTFHQPSLGMSGIDAQNSVEKDLCDVPSFFRNCASRMSSIHADLGVTFPLKCFVLSFENAQHVSHSVIKSVLRKGECQVCLIQSSQFAILDIRM